MIKSTYKRLISEKQRISIRLFISRLISPFYFGNNYYCTCCNKSFRKFKSKGNIKRANAECPYCQSLERVRLLDYYLDRELGSYKSKGIKVLHFAPEKSLFDKFSKLDIEYIDGDINANDDDSTINGNSANSAQKTQFFGKHSKNKIGLFFW